MEGKQIMIRCDEETYNWLKQIVKSGKHRSMNAALIAMIVEKANELGLNKKKKP